MKKKVMLIAMAIVAMAAATNAGVIYSETFDGDGSASVDGLTPGITTDGNVWASQNLQGTTMVADNGVYSESAGCALLPFEPAVNNVYTLSVDMMHLGIKYLGVGFTKNPIRPTAYNTGNRFPNVLGIAWFQYGHEDVAGEGPAIKLWGGPGSYTDGVKNDVIPNTGTYIGGEGNFVNLKVVLDTTGDGTSFTADFLMDDVSISGGPRIITLPVDDINYVGLDSYGPRSGASPIGSMVDNFEVSTVPSDSLAPLVNAGGDWVIWSGGSATLDATVVNNSDPQTDLTYIWTTDADGVVFDPAVDPADPNTSVSLTPTVTITKASGTAANVVLKLSANNVDSGKPDVVDTVTIKVYDDACLAALGEGVAIIDVTDFDGDCITNLADVVEVANQWLVDYQLTQSTDKL